MHRVSLLLMLLLLTAGCRNSTYNQRSQSSKSADQSSTDRVQTWASGSDQFEAEHDGMVLLKGGRFRMGTANGMPYEAPAHEVELEPFWIDQHDVTVEEFARFVSATGYRTTAERLGWSGVFDITSGEWQSQDGADWRHPDGAASTPNPNEPVTQVSWEDATQYAAWARKRLPSEAEWELAARGGLEGKTYVWGDDLRPLGRPVANWWQGHFPEINTGEDGFIGRSPFNAFGLNGFGLSDMAGNVWQWCADWYDDSYYSRSPLVAPTGPPTGIERVIRGGSWMCSENY